MENNMNQSAVKASNISLIALYTDGIWEARNPACQKFGKDNLHRIIRENAGRSSGEILDLCIKESCGLQKNAHYPDDVTLIIVKISIDQPESPAV